MLNPTRFGFLLSVWVDWAGFSGFVHPYLEEHEGHVFSPTLLSLIISPIEIQLDNAKWHYPPSTLRYSTHHVLPVLDFLLL
jgi:hypothetical protein